LPIGKLAVFFSHAILVAENKLRVCLTNIEGVFYESEYTPAFEGSEGRCSAAAVSNAQAWQRINIFVVLVGNFCSYLVSPERCGVLF